MTETLHWYAETSGGVQTGNCTVTENGGALHLTADLPAGTLKAVRAELPWTMEADERLFMNGYQTWTYSPELDRNGKLRGTDHIPGFLRKKYAFDRYGDYHFAPYGHQKGQSHGFSYCYFRKGSAVPAGGIAGRDAGLHHPPVRQRQSPADAGAGLRRGGASRRQLSHCFDLFFAEGGETEVFDGWFQAMGIKPRTEKKLAGYSSWYNRYQDITEDTIREDLTGCRSLLCPGDLFQIDDGWEPKVGDWLETDAQKFPHGLKGMVEEIHAAGFQAGLWLAPFVCEKDSALFRQHPDWLLKVDGKPWCCGSNWSSFLCAGYRQPGRAGLSAPGVRPGAERLGLRPCQAGFSVWRCPLWQRPREPGSPDVPCYGAFAHMVRAKADSRLRRTGDAGFRAGGLLPCQLRRRAWTGTMCGICACSIGSGCPQSRPSTTRVFRRQLNGRAYGSDPDVFFLREENCKLTAEQKRTLATVNALLGNVFLTSDMPSHYTDAQRAEYRRLRTLFEHATQVQAEAENDRLYIRYLLDGTPQKLCFDLF